MEARTTIADLRFVASLTIYFFTHIVLLITLTHIYLLIQLCRLKARMLLLVNKPKYYFRGNDAFVDIP